MIIGTITVDSGSVSTHRDSYLLRSLSVVAVRRPFSGVACLFSVGLAAFSIAFIDLLYLGEFLIIAIFAISIAIAGWYVGQLKLLSRDLRGSELSDVIWGSYGELNQVRRKIAIAMRSYRTGVER